MIFFNLDNATCIMGVEFWLLSHIDFYICLSNHWLDECSGYKKKKSFSSQNFAAIFLIKLKMKKCQNHILNKSQLSIHN